MSGFGADESVVSLGDLTARVGEVKIEGVTGKFWVPGVNESGERVIEMCKE